MAFEDLIARYESEPAAEPEPKSSGFADLIARYEPGAVTQREVPAPLGAWAQAQLVAANTLLPDVSAEDARELLRIAREDDLTPYETHEQIGLIKELRSIQQLQRTVEGARVLAGYLGPNYVMPLIQDRIDEMGTAEQTLRSIYEHSARGADVVATGFAGSRALFAGERATPRRGVAALEYPEALPLTASMAEQGPIMGATAVASAAPRAAGAAYGALIGALIGGPAGAAAGGRAGWQVGSVPGELAALTSGFSLEAGNLYQELSTYRDPDTRQQIDIDLARGASIAYGLVAGVLEAKGVDIVLNGVPAPIRRQVQNLNRGAIAKMMETRAGRAALSRFGRSVGDLLARAGSEGFTEVMQETMQNLVTAVVRASEGIDDPVDFTEGVAEAGVTGAEAAFGYGAIAMMIRGGSRWVTRQQDVRRAEETVNRLRDEVTQVLTEVNLPEHIERNMLDMIDEDAAGNSFEVPLSAVDRLYQDNLPEALQERVQEARATGAPVTLGAADVVAAARQEGFEAFLAEVAPAGRPSLRQAQENIKATMERLEIDLAAGVENDLYRQIYRELTDVGRTSELAHAEAILETARWESLAAGATEEVTGAQLRERYFGRIERETPQSWSSERLVQAADTGYAGIDLHEAGEWIAAAEAGVDLSLSARQQRAEDMGYELQYDAEGVPYYSGPSDVRSVHAAFDPDARKRREERIPGAPSTDKVYAPAVAAARAYADAQGFPYVEQALFAPVDVARARRIAEEFDRMPHAPQDPTVKQAYAAMIKETLAQYEAVLSTGLVVEFDPGNVYPNGPRDAIADVVENNHLYVFSTLEGFGSSDLDVSDNPLLAETKYRTADGRVMLANDVFRVVHDYFGHIKHGNGFRARGEENAWQAHASMYSPLARRAMTTETRGQNSWVNFGPHAEHNKTASGADTIYAPQKIGLLPVWVSEDGRLSAAERTVRFQRDLQAGRTGFEGAIDESGLVEVVHYAHTGFTRTDPSRWGRGLSRNVRSERAAQMGGAPGRTYFGIERATTNGYRKEAGLGGHRHVALLPGELIYNPHKDPDGLWDSRDPGVERRIRDAGYIGYFVNHPKLGKVVAVFDAVPVSEEHVGRLYQTGAVTRARAKAEKESAAAAEKLDKLTAEVEEATGLPIEEALAQVERLMVARTGLTDAEVEALAYDGVKLGLTAAQVRQVARQARAYTRNFSKARGWAQPTVAGITARVDENGDVVLVDGKPQLEPKWRPINYGFSKVDRGRMVDALVAEIAALYAKAAAGDARAQAITAQATWYRGVTETLRREFGGFGDLFADLLGATSPNTPVATNFKFSVQAAEQFLRGKYDATLAEFSDWVAAGKPVQKFPKEKRIKNVTGKLFGFNSVNAQLALLATWREIAPGQAPKARNFALNLIGMSDLATIDVWAARLLRRMAHQITKKHPRIPSAVETGVSGVWNTKATAITADFGAGVDIMAQASARLRDEHGIDITAPDLQAVAWFVEKDVWTRGTEAHPGPWTSAEGQGGSFEDHLARMPLDRFVAGVTIQEGKLVPSDDEMRQAEVALLAAMHSSPGVLMARARPTLGLYGGDVERAFDMEWNAERGAEVEEIVRQVARVAKAANQQDAIVSRVLLPDEDNPNARPGVEIYFKTEQDLAAVQPVLDKFVAAGIDGFTLTVDPRPARGGYIGARLQFVPELSVRHSEELRQAWRDPAALDAAALDAEKKMRGLINDLGDTVAHASVVNYTTLVMGKENYDGYIDSGIAENDRPGARGTWERRVRGEAVREAIERIEQGEARDRDLGGPVGRLYQEVPQRDDIEAAQRLAAGEISYAEYKATVDWQRLHQEGPKAPRGWIDLNTATITLTAKADQSTFMHESTHMYLHVLQRMELEGIAGAQQRADLAALREWTGKPPGHVFTAADVDAHEQIARGFEAYLLEGNPPTPELRGAFRRLHAFMVQIYRSIRQLDVDLTPQIREVFARSIAAEDAIAAATPRRLDVAGLVTADVVTALDQQWERSVEEADNTGRDRAMRAAIATYRRERQERKLQLQMRVAVELSDRPVYRALQFLKDGSGLDIPRMQLNRAAVLQILGTRAVPESLRGERTVKEGGVHPDTLAPMFGYDSGAAMLTEMAAAPPYHKALKQITEQRLEAEYPVDPKDTAAMAELAAEAWHNEERAKYLETLINGLGSVPNMRGLAKAQARELIAKIPLKNMQPARYLRAEHQVRKQQAEAVAAGDKALARDLLLKELLLHYMYLEARGVVREYDKLRALARRMQKDRARYGKLVINGERPFLAAVDGLLGHIDTTELSFRKLNNIPMHQVPAAGTMAQVQQAVSDIAAADPTVDILISDDLLTTQYMLNYRAMTPQQIRDMTLALRSLHHTMLRWNKLRIAGELMDREEVINQVIDNIETNATLAPREHLGLSPDKTSRWTKLRDIVRGSAIMPEVLVMDMDGGKPGFMHRVFYAPFKAAEQKRTQLREQYLQRFADLRNEMAVGGTVSFMGTTITREYLYGVALNLGTQSNTDKFLKGELKARRFPLLTEQTTRDDVIAALWAAGFRRDDWRRVQRLLDLIEEMKPLTFDIAENVTGLRPPEVPAVAVTLPDGTGLRGGYYPMRYDQAFAQLWETNLMQQHAGAEALWGSSGTRANVGSGFHEARTNFAAPVRLDLAAAYDHIMDTTHYAAFYEPVVAAYHIIQNYRVKGAIVSRYGDQVHRALESMVQDVAKQGKREGGALKPYEPILADARATVTTAFFGMKALTILDTFFGGVTTSLSTVSPRAFFTALSLDSPVRDSVVLEGRRKTFLRELAEQEAILSNPQTSPRRRLLALSTRALMFPMGVVQERIDSMVWHATYAQAVLDNVADPVRHADAAVTTLSPTGTQHGMSMVQRGNEMEKSLTAFMSWTLPVLSNSWRLYNAGKRGQGYGRLVQYTILASVLPSLIAAVLRDEIPDDDDDDWIDFTRWAVADFMLAPYLGGVPVLNSAVPITKGQSISHSLAVEGLLTQSVKGAVAVFDVLSGEKDLDDLTKSDINGMLMLVSGMSVMVGGVALPVSQTNELIQLATHWDELDDLRDLLRFKE